MAVYAGPEIVTNGLVLALDAGNTQSYPGSGTTWTDISPNRLSGTLTNGPTFSSNNKGAIVFDGTNDFISFGSFTGLGTTNRSIEIWFAMDGWGVSGNKRIMTLSADDGGTDTPAYVIGHVGGVVGTISAGVGGTPYNGYSNISTSIGTGVWYNITTTIVANTTVSFYLNGVFVTSVNNTGAVGANPIIQLARYNANYGQHGNCRISSCRIYNRVLSASEVAQNFNALRGRFGI